MKSCIASLLLSLSVLAGLFSGCADPDSGCKSDDDCRFGRVCVEGLCADTGQDAERGDVGGTPDDAGDDSDTFCDGPSDCGEGSFCVESSSSGTHRCRPLECRRDTAPFCGLTLECETLQNGRIDVVCVADLGASYRCACASQLGEMEFRYPPSGDRCDSDELFRAALYWCGIAED